MVIHMHKRISLFFMGIMISALALTGCSSQTGSIGFAKEGEPGGQIDTGFTVTGIGDYDSADTAVVVAVDQDNRCVTFLNMGTGRQYTLYYDGTTYIKDKHDGPMTISQIKAGDIMDVCFLKGKRQIASMKMSPDAWIYEKIQNYDLGGINKTASIGSMTYSLPDDVLVLSEGERVEVMDIVKQDVVTIHGIDHQICSISVERGHGYLRLKNDQALIGGWIEVGNSVIREITEDMLLIVPEGSYQVSLTNDNVSCMKEITVERDKETVLDVGDAVITEDKTGRILFSVTPENAVVTVDGQTVDIEKAVELPYGIHKVHLEAEGYDSLTKYVQVGSEYAQISFTLEESVEPEDDNYNSISQNDIKEKEEEEPEEESVSENTISAKNGNKVYIDAPKGVEVYLDGNYVGVTPVSFKKRTGAHSVTLRKNGYYPKSYTIYLYDDGEDVTYSFSDLIKEEKVDNVNKTSSDSTASKDECICEKKCKEGSVNVDCPVCALIKDFDAKCKGKDDTVSGNNPTVSDNDPSGGHVHKYTETVTKKATCTEDGEKKWICECGDIDMEKTETIPATGHSFVNGVCTVCKAEHEHEYKEEVKEATCTEDGERKWICECGDIDKEKTETIPATGHSFVNGVCTVCKAEHEHEYKETVKEATCTEAGEKEWKCECGAIEKTEPIPPKGHNFESGECTVCHAPEPSPSKNDTE